MAKINWKEKQFCQEAASTEMDYVMLAIAELDAQREMDKTENEMAIAELAEVLMGGVL